MGRSTASCFKIISCGGSNESVDRDDIDASSENKDKRGWSFRKRSARHRVLSNTVITETPPLENKTSSEPVTLTSEPQINSSISEKTCDSIWTEDSPQLKNSITKDATVSTMATNNSNTPCEDDIKSEPVVDESAILVIQSAVRRFLAQRELVRHKKVVKLQAAVRGHLVRNHAVGTLRCVQAIVKMQALVRARRADVSSVRADVAQPTYISIEKLLSNSLARQLLESTPKTKQINIKCVPSKSDSAWNWLERWMSVSTPETVESVSHAPEQNQDQEKINDTGNEVQTVTPECASMELESKEDSVNTEEKSNERNHEEETPQPINTNTQKPENLLEESMDLVVEKSVSETEEPKRVTKRLATDEADSEGRKSVFGSRKASNPAFIAAQSRFEELTSKNNNPTKEAKPSDSSKQENDNSTPADISPSNPSKPVDSSCNQDNDAGTPPSDPLKPSANSSKQENDDPTPEDITPSNPSKPVDNSCNQDNDAGTPPSDPLIPSANSSKQENEDPTPENIIPSDPSKPLDNSSNQENDVITPDEYLVSECGTELSVTSTLDSPDQSVVETKKLLEDSKVSNEEIDVINNNINSNNNDIKSIEDHKNYVETEKPNPTKLNETPSEADIEIELEPNSDSGHRIPEASSPRSHITAPESQGTPNSQLSTNTNKSKKKASSSQKRKSWSTSKKSTADSGLRASLENLPKEPKPGKRRNSFGSPRPDNSDHEGNGPLPSYMQATESARAKAIANGSPRSSPDVQDKEIYLKKRHSLPGGGGNGRHGSPRIQRSMSQALESKQGNGNQERKWQR